LFPPLFPPPEGLLKPPPLPPPLGLLGALKLPDEGLSGALNPLFLALSKFWVLIWPRSRICWSRFKFGMDWLLLGTGLHWLFGWRCCHWLLFVCGR
jgi:hypothetical protein